MPCLPPPRRSDLLATAPASHHCACPRGSLLCHRVNLRKKLPETGRRLRSRAASPFPPGQTPPMGSDLSGDQLGQEVAPAAGRLTRSQRGSGMEMRQDAFNTWMALTDGVTPLNVKPCALVPFNSILQIKNIKRLHQGSGNQ